MESHEQFMRLVFLCLTFCFFKHIIGHRVVYIQQCWRMICGAGKHIFAQCTIDICLAGYRYTPASQARVDITGNETEGSLKRRPAFIGKDTKLAGTPMLIHEFCE